MLINRMSVDFALSGERMTARETHPTEWEINRSDISLCGENTQKSFSPSIHFIIFDRGWAVLKASQGFLYPRMQWETPISAIGGLLCGTNWIPSNLYSPQEQKWKSQRKQFFFSRSESCWKIRRWIAIIVRVSRWMLENGVAKLHKSTEITTSE